MEWKTEELSGRVLNLRLTGHRFETQRVHCVVSLSETSQCRVGEQGATIIIILLYDERKGSFPEKFPHLNELKFCLYGPMLFCEKNLLITFNIWIHSNINHCLQIIYCQENVCLLCLLHILKCTADGNKRHEP